ncbi:MAG: hypothetical protein AAF914_02180 [Pseudomonadota bacterium]
MPPKLCAGLIAAAIALASSADAQSVRITGDAAVAPIDNDFVDSLPGTLVRGARLELDARSRLIFTPVAAESGNHNTLTIAGLGSLSEDRDFGWSSRAREQLVGDFAAGRLDQLIFFTSDFGDDAAPGMDSFGVFVDGAAGGRYTTFFLVYDDTAGDDGDYDDYIIRVDVAPVD